MEAPTRLVPGPRGPLCGISFTGDEGVNWGLEPELENTGAWHITGISSCACIIQKKKERGVVLLSSIARCGAWLGPVFKTTGDENLEKSKFQVEFTTQGEKCYIFLFG